MKRRSGTRGAPGIGDQIERAQMREVEKLSVAHR
jgi:hypothetical protein